MTQVRRFSLVYDIAEDRLAWDVEDLAGATSRLWLTQRLSRGLVTAMLPLLHTSAGAAAPSQHAATLQSWEQAAAMADFGKVPAVQPQPEATVGLIRSVEIQPTPDGMVLAIDFGGGDLRSISLTDAAVRQMLSVIHRLYEAAGWPLDIWPAWIADPTAQAEAGRAN